MPDPNAEPPSALPHTHSVERSLCTGTRTFIVHCALDVRKCTNTKLDAAERYSCFLLCRDPCLRLRFAFTFRSRPRFSPRSCGRFLPSSSGPCRFGAFDLCRDRFFRGRPRTDLEDDDDDDADDDDDDEDDDDESLAYPLWLLSLVVKASAAAGAALPASVDSPGPALPREPPAMTTLPAALLATRATSRSRRSAASAASAAAFRAAFCSRAS